MFTKILDNPTGQTICSIILGLGLAIIFSRACNGRNCIVVRGPNPNTVNGKIYQFDNDCYKFNSFMSTCGKKQIKTDK